MLLITASGLLPAETAVWTCDSGSSATAALPLRGESLARYAHVRGAHSAANVGILNSDPVVYGDYIGSCQLALLRLLGAQTFADELGGTVYGEAHLLTARRANG